MTQPREHGLDWDARRVKALTLDSTVPYCLRPNGHDCVHPPGAVHDRHPAHAMRTFDLTRYEREPRGGLCVDVELFGHLVHLFNVHFGLRVRERAAQVELLVREHVLHEALRGSRVVVGDLNEWFPGAVGRTLRRELAGPRIRRTHPAPLPLFPLDRIYWDRALHGRFQVHRSRLARVASDHLPIIARLQLPAPAAATA